MNENKFFKSLNKNMLIYYQIGLKAPERVKKHHATVTKVRSRGLVASHELILN
jgi:hypothetical protein